MKVFNFDGTEKEADEGLIKKRNLKEMEKKVKNDIAKVKSKKIEASKINPLVSRILLH